MDVQDIFGSWVHSHEESQGDRVVMRRPDYPFPPSRGRARIALDPGGQVGVKHPGPDDRTVSDDGSWSLSGSHLQIAAPGFAGDFEVESAAPDALVLRRIRKAE